MVDCSPNTCVQAGEAEGQGEEIGEPWGHRLLRRGSGVEETGSSI